MLKVYKQMPPLGTGQRFTRYDSSGELRQDEWCSANLRLLGEVETWSQAKALTTAPVVEQVRG